MDKSEINVSYWVEDRLQSRPNATRGLAPLKARNLRRFRFIWATAAAANLCVGFLLLAAPRPTSLVPPPAPVPMVAVPRQPDPMRVVVAAERPPKNSERAAPAVGNFKESGSPTARVTCEIYADYECPACAAYYRDNVPALVTEYVRTGKIKLLHRDYPLPQHAYSRLAARYANAAGELGYYDVVVAQIFKTQDVWGKDGDVGAQVAQVLPPGVMQKVRQMVKDDAISLDKTVEADLAMGRDDHLTQTPMLVIVANGKRQILPGLPSFNILKAYLDQVLTGK